MLLAANKGAFNPANMYYANRATSITMHNASTLACVSTLRCQRGLNIQAFKDVNTL